MEYIIASSISTGARQIQPRGLQKAQCQLRGLHKPPKNAAAPKFKFSHPQPGSATKLLGS